MSQAKQEVQALWRAVFNEPPVIDTDPALMLELIIRCSGPPAPYGGDGRPKPRDLTPPDDTCVPCGR